MSRGAVFFMSGLMVLVMCMTVSAFSKRPAADWNYYHFDGHRFISGQPANGGAYLALRDGVLPVFLPRPTKVEAVALPAGKGALAGICYIQRSGGKLSESNGHLPCPPTYITISTGNTAITSVLSDENGYFMALLPPGRYRVSSGAFVVETKVEIVSTVLVPLRAGKRMVD